MISHRRFLILTIYLSGLVVFLKPMAHASINPPEPDTISIHLAQYDTTFMGIAAFHGDYYKYTDHSDTALIELTFGMGAIDMGQGSCHSEFKLKPGLADGLYVVYVNGIVYYSLLVEDGQRRIARCYSQGELYSLQKLDE